VNGSPWEIWKGVLGSRCDVFPVGRVRGRTWDAGVLSGCCVSQGLSWCWGTGRSTAGEGCGYPACPEPRNPRRHAGAAGSARHLSSVLPFKQSSLAVMARSHGDERCTGCLHPRELPGRGIAAAPGRIPSSIHGSKPRRWWGPPGSPCARGSGAPLSQRPSGRDGGRVLAESVAASSKAAG